MLTWKKNKKFCFTLSSLIIGPIVTDQWSHDSWKPQEVVNTTLDSGSVFIHNHQECLASSD